MKMQIVIILILKKPNENDSHLRTVIIQLCK